jgi:hypothetical protein
MATTTKRFIAYEKKRVNGRVIVWGYGTTEARALADARRWITQHGCLHMNLTVSECNEAVINWVDNYSGDLVPLRVVRGVAQIVKGARVRRSPYVRRK